MYFYPTVDQQTMCDNCGEQGMNGDLVIVYDVNRNNGLGDIKVNPDQLDIYTQHKTAWARKGFSNQYHILCLAIK